MELGLEGRVALVVGGGRGIGRAVVEALAREGARVAALSRTAEEVEAAAAAVRASGGDALGVTADVTDLDALDLALTRVRTALGPPTIVVLAAAALYRPTKLHNVTDGEAAELLAVDLGGAVSVCRRVLPDMMLAGHGRIVAVGSVAARTGLAGASLYGAAKAALEGLVRGLAVDYSKRGVTANVANVGFADTERLKGRVAGRPEARERLVAATATRHIPAPAEIADVIAFLCSDRAATITGAVVDVTAGAHLNNVV